MWRKFRLALLVANGIVMDPPTDELPALEPTPAPEAGPEEDDASEPTGLAEGTATWDAGPNLPLTAAG